MIQDFSGAKELQKEEVHSFLVRIDKDGNGKIDKKELVHFIVDGIAMEEEEKIEYASRGKFQKHMIDFFDGIKNAKDIFIRDGKSGLRKYFYSIKTFSFVRVPAAIKIQCLWRSYIAYQEMAHMRTMMINVSEMNTFFNEIWSKYDTNLSLIHI